MITEKITLVNKKRFLNEREISRNKLIKAAEIATNKLEENLQRFTYDFTPPSTTNYVYESRPNIDWTNGMHTGMYWLAYELTGNKKFRDAAEIHMKSFQDRLDNKIGLSDHDVGFLYVPSAVAGYKVTGNENYRKMALDAAKHLYDFSYTEKGGFIIRVNGHNPETYSDYRTMMDTLMNISLFFWTYKETGEEKYRDAAIAQCKTTLKYLVRSDGSTFHHYQFDPENDNPVKGLTFQGYSDDSCWARGQSWGVYGLAIAYSYIKEEFLKEGQQNVSYYFLNKLPNDGVSYWDLIFTEESEEPRDSSASAIVSCGLDEMSRLLTAESEEQRIFKNASDQILEGLIEKCGNVTDKKCDGILKHVTHALPQGIGIDESAIYGDYFYLESLLRKIKPEWKMYW